MEKINLNYLLSKLNADLLSKKVSGRILLDRFRVIDEDSRKTAPYLSDNYATTYYHLGKYIEPKSVVEIGFDLGLLSACFLTSCKSVENFLGFKEASKDFASIRLGKKNIRLVFKKDADYYIGKLYDKEFDEKINLHELIILNIEQNYDKHLEYLDFMWEHLKEHGIIVAEYINRHTPAKEAFIAFCESKNREYIQIPTRYGTGICQK